MRGKHSSYIMIVFSDQNHIKLLIDNRFENLLRRGNSVVTNLENLLQTGKIRTKKQND